MRNRTIIEGSPLIVNSAHWRRASRFSYDKRKPRGFQAFSVAIGERFVARFRSLSHRRCSTSPMRAIVPPSNLRRN
jgi:hypothetical protein